MPPASTRTPLITYNYGSGATAQQAAVEPRFAPVFQPTGSGAMFAPGYPLVPPDYERPRRFNYPVGYNYIYTPRAYEPVGFEELRMLAQTHDLTRLAIETRKDQVEAQDWQIQAKDTKKATKEQMKRAEERTKFWQRPDGYNPFGTWLRMLLEDLLVLDAPTAEVRRTRGGDVVSLDIIDGATIKVLIDETGRRPLPPAPAYEQVIHGRPWVLTEDGVRQNTEDEGKPIFGHQLIYMPRNPRSHKIYGFSPVEQILMTVNTALRRQVQQLQWFTDGNLPAGLLNAPEGWNAAQLAEYQQNWDAFLQGNTAERSKILWGPWGAKYQAFKEPPLKDEFDEWLARVVMYAFSLPPTAFTKQINRGETEAVKESSLREGLEPIKRWVVRFINEVERRIGNEDLTFAWEEEEALDAKDQSAVLIGYVKEGIYTRDEAREDLGKDPLPDGVGAEPMADTAQGPVLLEHVINPPEPQMPLPAAGDAAARTLATPNPARSPRKPAAGNTDKPAAQAVQARPRGKSAPVQNPSQKAAGLSAVRRLGKGAVDAGGAIDPANAVPVTQPVVDDDTRAEVDHRAWDWVRTHQHVSRGEPEIEDVPIADMVATQPVVDETKVREHEAHWLAQGSFDEPPIVLSMGGAFYVLDGHHHIEGAQTAGATALPCLVIEGDAPHPELDLGTRLAGIADELAGLRMAA